ncbi:site-specific DNA-methyltransferase [Halomonas marinisediminis]|uniref:site-specific DNA-methyltransferase (adenine-specific) n=1 Tax=Halomonas marinisediminis TaxID=2546095 RepID=A0ABY2D5N2_9GAMM|nr:site-specific DNA-methyltransferase [Halomonas marinisediminis]TDB01987.1 site-specific DNA-methyltransferase [Halomonas marinisediminis]
MSQTDAQLRELILTLVPDDGNTIGNARLLKQLSEEATEVDKLDYERVRDGLIKEGVLGKGRGRGGSVYRLTPESEDTVEAPAPDPGAPDLSLQMQEVPAELPLNQQPVKPRKAPRAGQKKPDQSQVLSYRFEEKRKNNPHVGMVDTASDGVEETTTWAYDPHLDPELQFDSSANRAQIEALIDEALASGDQEQMKAALEELKRRQSPYLQWTGKAERTSFEVDTVSLHVHERIDPATILGEVQKRMKAGKNSGSAFQPDMFHAPFENLPLREAIDFYKHERDWANRLIAGDSLLVMNSMLQKEGMAGQVQMIYIDPPYGIKYGSNFQPFTNKRDVKDRKDEDLTQEPEMIKAFRDTWELGIHSYLTYLRDRLLLARELLSDSGSVFVQISDVNLHHVRELMDEVFGANNLISVINFVKTAGQSDNRLAGVSDYLVWYARDQEKLKYNQLYRAKSANGDGGSGYNRIEESSGLRRSIKKGEDITQLQSEGAKVLTSQSVESQSPGTKYEVPIFGLSVLPKGYWKTERGSMPRLKMSNRLMLSGSTLRYVRYLEDFPVFPIVNLWSDTGVAGFSSDKKYVVETSTKVVERCMLMATDPGDLVLDPTCGSGTTAYVAEKWGRRWVTCDTSRVAVTLAKQRLMTASYDYYELKYPHEGLGGGFIYKTVPHITLKSIANNPEIDELYEQYHPSIEKALADLNLSLKDDPITFTVTEGGRKGDKVDFSAPDSKTVTLPSGETAQVNELLEWEVPFDFPDEWPEAAKPFFEAFHSARQTMQRRMDESIANHAGQEVLYDQPEVSRDKLRITGPFTVEAVPFATVLGLDEAEQPKEADVAVARSGATSRHAQWREELLKAGIRGKGGQHLKLMDLETLPGAKYLHAVGTVAETGERVAVSFGPEYAALEQRQVEIAKNEAGDLFPLPKLLVFCAFTFDPEAAKDIDSIKGIQALKVQMNTDLLTEDLKKNARSNESFWLMGQPDVEVHTLMDGKLQVEVHGFDYFDTKSGELKSGGKRDIAVWELDTDYDDRSLYPRQVFFPMAGKKDGWYKLKKDIRAELNEELLGQYHGTRSLPFEPGDNRCIAVKIVDNRGIESLKVVRLD